MERGYGVIVSDGRGEWGHSVWDTPGEAAAVARHLTDLDPRVAATVAKMIKVEGKWERDGGNVPEEKNDE